MAKKGPLYMIAVWLVIIGGLNWGLVGIGMLAGTNLNVVNMILGSISWLEAVVYILVGLAALMKLAMMFKKSE
ncbi:MAG: DUF378 domain-containing protein [Candidatus Gracilibacteria bacterium]|nr:DUF378 domain-containing protein [Candidatus Peregrinibacteria bacterium]